MNADYASVIEQSGIYAGDDSYQINIQNHTDLKGGLITSSQTAEDNGNNRFETGTLSYSDIRNHADYSASGFGLGGDISMNVDLGLGDNVTKQSNVQKINENGEPIYQAEGIENTNGVGEKVLAEGWDSLTGNMSYGVGYDSEHSNSITKSGINTANIKIRDTDNQLEKTGKTAETSIANIKTDIITQSAVDNSGKLERNFDKDAVQKELDTQIQVTAEFKNNALDLINSFVDSKQAPLREKLQEALNRRDNAKTKEEYEQAKSDIDGIVGDIYAWQYENSGKLAQNFDKEKVLKELNIQVKVTQDFRKNAFATIDAYVLPKQAELREKIKQAKTEEEKTALYDEIYKLQYQKRLLETVVGIVAGSPELAITQGTLQLAATKMREETLANSRLFKGIKDAKTGDVLRNDSYDSGYFDGVKLGGVRIDVNLICGQALERCLANKDGSYNYIGDQEFGTLSSFLKSDKANNLYGLAGGFQSVQGGWYLPWDKYMYDIGSMGDLVVESFAGAHDRWGGQIWGWYDDKGNTAPKTKTQEILSGVTTGLAIPATMPFAVADLISSDMMEVLFKLGAQ
ncbi:MAG: hypothetical protein SPE06_11580 [[Actinobacillus] rossii]|nr:hypothetical protein [[Actinobacillus] rossii]